MALVNFFKYKGKWLYRIKGEEQPKDLDTYALESVLGVVGGPEVIVVRKTVDDAIGDVLHIKVQNGFITKAEVGSRDGDNFIEFGEVLSFWVDPIS